MKRSRGMIIMVGTFVLSLYAAHLWLKRWDLACLLLGSIFAHEMGHVIALRYWGIPSNLVFVPFLGAGTIPQGVAIKRLHHWGLAVLSLAGPIVNGLIMILSFWLYRTLGSRFWLQSVSLNAGLAAWNLVPLGIFDGGRFTNAIFASLGEDEDETVATILAIIAMLLGGIMIGAGKFTFFHLLVYIGIKKGAMEDDPQEHWSSKAMESNQALILVSLYLLLLAGSWLADVFLPSWLK